jgi:hypothetical protein
LRLDGFDPWPAKTRISDKDRNAVFGEHFGQGLQQPFLIFRTTLEGKGDEFIYPVV